jgi:hypothetical protein
VDLLQPFTSFEVHLPVADPLGSSHDAGPPCLGPHQRISFCTRGFTEISTNTPECKRLGAGLLILCSIPRHPLPLCGVPIVSIGLFFKVNLFLTNDRGLSALAPAMTPIWIWGKSNLVFFRNAKD